MYIIAIGWMYVVLMMAITESSVVAAIMTLLMYGVLPVSIILYLGHGIRKRRRQTLELQLQIQQQSEFASADSQPISAADDQASNPKK